jgi:NTP pyrophosphatase (non-canonical NTP hydrolase)
VEMQAYERSAVKTIQAVPDQSSALTIALLGLAGEAGAVMTAHKKQLRDGAADPGYRARMREELGDALWYLTAVAHHLGLGLEDIATANLSKITDRWRPTPATAIPFDTDLDPAEQLPRQSDFVFTLSREPGGREISVLTRDGHQVGDPITNASHIADGYCFHDIFHLAYAAVLGWSPVMRALLKCKRRSNPQTDEAEDGGRAVVIEEGIAALVFAYASRHHYLEGKSHVDNNILDTIQTMVAHLEVGAHRTADWEKAILTGFAAWRTLRQLGGGAVHLDLDAQTLTVTGPATESQALEAAPEAPRAPDELRAAIALMHRQKDAAYGDSWKRGGELISIMANIARKVDRLPNQLATQSTTADESTLDTVVDLHVYALKYLTYLADTDPNLLPDVLPQRPDGEPWSDGTEGVERLLERNQDTLSATRNVREITEIVDAIQTTFSKLEKCFASNDGPAPARTRVRFATDFSDQTAELIAALNASQPALSNAFVDTWAEPARPTDGEGLSR